MSVRMVHIEWTVFEHVHLVTMGASATTINFQTTSKRFNHHLNIFQSQAFIHEKFMNWVYRQTSNSQKLYDKIRRISR